jgi:hypothetical protein
MTLNTALFEKSLRLPGFVGRYRGSAIFILLKLPGEHQVVEAVPD